MKSESASNITKSNDAFLRKIYTVLDSSNTLSEYKANTRKALNLIQNRL